jgi:hypothetical protein
MAGQVFAPAIFLRASSAGLGIARPGNPDVALLDPLDQRFRTELPIGRREFKGRFRLRLVPDPFECEDDAVCGSDLQRKLACAILQGKFACLQQATADWPNEQLRPLYVQTIAFACENATAAFLAARNHPGIKRLLPHDQESQSRVGPVRRAGKNRRSVRVAIVDAGGGRIKR